MMKKRIVWGLLAAVLLCVAAIWVYLSDYYRADVTALESLAQEESVTVTETEDTKLVFVPEEPKAGLLFYPGGKVEYTAYAPLMEELAKQDILCILIRMPGNLAVLDIDAAKGLVEEYTAQYPEITDWYLAGHSLGGSMGATYAAEHAEELAGVILLGAYSTADLKDTGLKVLSIYGSNDGVLSREKYQKYLENLPEDFTEVVLEGGSHAGFGSYGEQKGDGIAEISGEEQVKQTVEAICTEVFGRVTNKE